MDDDWVTAAITDDDMVANVLLRMKHHDTHVAQRVLNTLKTFPLRWVATRPRSIPESALPLSRCDDNNDAVLMKKEERTTTTRCSPTSPFSWNGGAASPPSATADGFEASSLNRSPPSSRSKVDGGSPKLEQFQGTIRNETTTESSKKSKKRKTHSELKEVENTLLQERMNLRKQLAALRCAFEEERVVNRNLKRLKLHMSVQTVNSAASDKLEEASKTNHDCSVSSTHPTSNNILQSISCRVEKDAVKQERVGFVTPDLNMLPSEENPCMS